MEERLRAFTSRRGTGLPSYGRHVAWCQNRPLNSEVAEDVEALTGLAVSVGAVTAAVDDVE
jgi:hypothetical protein